MRPGNRNMCDGLVDFEKLQAVPGELLAQNSGDLQGESALVFPDLADEAQQLRTTQGTRSRAAQGVTFNRLDDVVFVLLAKVLFYGLHISEAQRLGHVEAQILCFPALLIDPLFDYFLVANDPNPRFVCFKRHAAKPFAMNFSKLVLVIMIIGRSQDDTAHTALSNESIFSFRWFGGGAFGLVKSAKMFPEDMADSFVLVQPERIIQRANKKWLEGLAFGIFFDRKRNG